MRHCPFYPFPIHNAMTTSYHANTSLQFSCIYILAGTMMLFSSLVQYGGTHMVFLIFFKQSSDSKFAFFKNFIPSAFPNFLTSLRRSATKSLPSETVKRCVLTLTYILQSTSGGCNFLFISPYVLPPIPN